MSDGLPPDYVVTRQEAIYPPLAKAARMWGSVSVEVTVGEDGTVVNARAISGHPVFRDSAVTAARGWTFKPTLIGGQPVQVITSISFNFALRDGREIEEIKKAIAADPSSAVLYFKLGRAYHDDGLSADDRLIDAFKKATDLKPDWADAWMELGKAYFDTPFDRRPEDRQLAIRAFERVVGLRNDEEAYVYLGNSYPYLVTKGEDGFGMAISAFNEALAIHPDAASAHFGLAVIYEKLERNDEAIAELKRALESKPKQEGRFYVPYAGLQRLSRLYQRLERWKEAADAYKQMLTILPSDPEAHYGLAVTSLAMGDKATATTEYEKLKEIRPELAEILLKEISK
jgi:TonB family protein